MTRSRAPDHSPPVIGDGRRWTPERKMELVRQVRAGEVSLVEAQHRHGVGRDELASWGARIDRHGLMGVKATRLQEVRA